MITWRNGIVVSRGKSWPGAQELVARLADGTDVRALAYLDVVGLPELGDSVALNTTALVKGLGTGGYALVVANASRLPADPAPAPGHLVKARYTPLQTMVLGADEQDSPHHAALRDADDLGGMPVIVADLHSALPAVLAGMRHRAAELGIATPRAAYLMTDGGALPAAFSRTVGTLRETGWLDSCITVGQAYGGDLETVTVHTGLLAARLIERADVAVVAQGPGNLGTGTRWGFSGVAVGEAVNAAAVLRGRPVGSLRVSGADLRERHLGVSHHSLTAYGRVALVPADVPVPVPAAPVEALDGWGAELSARISRQADTLTAPAGIHRRVDVVAGDNLVEALRTCPVRLSTMGRGLDEDPAAFVAAAVAGQHAVDLLHG